jgi:thioredoxin-dependent peroxiredoxin
MLGKLLRKLLPLPGAKLTLKPGDRAPEWECRDHRGELVSSSQLHGTRYLLWFYPKASTPG